MIQVEPRALLKTLNSHCTKALESAAGVCVSRGHYEVSVEHVLAQLLENPNADVYLVLRRSGIEAARIAAALERVLESLRSGNPGRPVFSPLLMAWFQDAWLLSSAEYRWPSIRSASLLATLIFAPGSHTGAGYVDLLKDISPEHLRRQLPALAAGSIEDEEPLPSQGAAAKGSTAPSGAHGRGPETALGRFTNDFTAQARAGELDPVVGREAEIRQCIDILARRRKNNPIIVGEAGVGKTALVEGLALRVVAKEVPAQLANVDILGLDLGLLQAGAGVKGEFENRLKSVIDEVKASPKPIILFIDEAHMMIGAGGSAGGSDAANLLKPALARGELRTVAATTWSEYKKFFEKDAALTRRFQLVKVDEPSEQGAIAMMRGLCPGYEASHKVHLRDDAVVAAVELSNRYISGRQLPDKAVDLLDTCAARVAIARDAKPARLLDLDRTIEILGRERSSLEREVAEGYPPKTERLIAIQEQLERTASEKSTLETRWLHERELVHQILDLRQKLSDAAAGATARSTADAGVSPSEAPAPATPAAAGPPPAAPAPPPAGGAAPASATEPAGASPGATRETLRAELEKTHTELEGVQADGSLVPVDVSPELIASVVSDWTGIPVGRMLEDEATTLLEFEIRLAERIKGQPGALQSIGEYIRSSKAGLGNPRTPIGVFLMVGPSGIGKTETGRAIADLLFGGERFMTSINMSEFQEKHTVSRLIGSPPGYVGFGEGGVLTEAVRQRPYSAVILDEVEKADPEVMNLFYQVFDKGELADGEGRVIDFKNTVMMMTSNLGSEIMTQLCSGDSPVTKNQVVEAIRPTLVRHFKPALLARMTIVPYFPLSPDAMREIVELKLSQLQDRMQQTHRIELHIAAEIIEQITQRCTEVETGARNIDHILSRTLLPMLSRAVLSKMSEGAMPPEMYLSVVDGEYVLDFQAPALSTSGTSVPTSSTEVTPTPGV